MRNKALLRISAIAITAVMCTLVILSAVFPFPEASQRNFLKSERSLSVSAQESGSPAYQVLIPTEVGTETGLQVFPPKLQDGGDKDNWLAVQSPDGLNVPVGTMILDEDGDPVGVNASIGDIYIDSVTDCLVISAGTLSDKCPKDIDIVDYTLYGNETLWNEDLGKNLTTLLGATFRSYVYGSGSDTYQLENTPQRWDSRDLPVVSLTIYATVKGTVVSSTAATRINTATKKYNGSEIPLGVSSDTLIDTTYTINPNTGNPWTWAEVDGLEAGVTLKNSAECSYIYVQVETEVRSQTFFPITPVDVTPSTGSWLDVDCSSHIASGATGVLLHIVNAGAAYSAGIRKNGSTDARYSDIYIGAHHWSAIGVDANRKFEARLENASTDIYLVAYTMSGVTFFTNAYDKSLSWYDAWRDLDCSSQCPSAIGLIWEPIAGTQGYVYGFRKNGSTDDRKLSLNSFATIGVIIGCDGSQVCEGWADTSTIDFYLTGYVTDGATFYTNALDRSLGSTGTWIDLTALPANTGMGFYNVHAFTHPGSYEYGLRKNGSSENLYEVAARMNWAFVECDSSWTVEGKTGHTSVDFYLIGYSEAAACSPSISLNTYSWNVNSGNLVSENSNYSSGLAYFRITNNSGGAVTITIGGADMTGGGYTWDLSDDGSVGDMIYGMKAGLSGGDYTIVVKETAPYNTLKAGLADSGTQDFGLKIYTPTNFDDGNDKSGAITLTAACD